MKISILTLFPKMISSFFGESIVKRAKDKGLVEIEIVNLRDFAKDNYGSVDDRPYGGGAGMVMRVDVFYKALAKIKTQKAKTVLTSAKGKQFSQQKAKEYAKLAHLILIAGHYEGIDERVLDLVDEEISLGDFVLTGGEIVIAAIVDSVVRLIPGVLKKEDATQWESFFAVPIDQLITAVGETEVLKKAKAKGKTFVQLLEYPHYTRPEEHLGKKIPAILLSGDHKVIAKWRLQEAYKQTLQKRPDLLSF